MKKKYIILSFFICLICIGYLQSKPSHYDLFPKPATFPIEQITSSIKTRFTSLPHDTCLDKKFSVVFYLIQDSLYTLPNNVPPGNPLNTVLSYSLNQIIDKLNQTFSVICVSFENCKTVIIPNYSYNKWTKDVTESIVTANWYTEKTINIYIPLEFIPSSATEKVAFSSDFPTTGPAPKDYIVIQKSEILSNNFAPFSGSALLHAVGHFFGLPHTFAEINGSTVLPDGPSTEVANGSNGATTGDNFSDTEADPYPSGYSVGALNSPICGYFYTPGKVDPTGKYYTPPVDNLMSIYSCRCRFTQEQYNYMAYKILTKRLYLH